MENFENKEQEVELSPEEKLENFRGEITEIKEGEMEKKAEWEARGQKGAAYNPHFDGINPEFLSATEMDLYEKVKEGNLNEEKFRELCAEVAARMNKEDEDKPEHQTVDYFLMYMANIFNAQNMRKQIEKLKKEQ